ncbi:receptor-like protein kinase [Glycine soja]|uniref:receptor-like protein kinase n=1 Tax=Glycine soja TaxID=3848 RepID=UPI001038EF34|nr:receptor-like protein kinase [Glycine soja]
MVYQEGAKLGLIQIALSGTSDAAGDVEEAVATLGDEGAGVEGEPAEAEGGGERDVDGEQPGERCEKEAEEGGELGERGGDEELCYKQLTGRIPTQLGDLKKLSVLALQSNLLGGAIPASLGDLGKLMRLDLNSNNIFGFIPIKLADLPSLQVLDVHNNTLSGNVHPDNLLLTEDQKTVKLADFG